MSSSRNAKSKRQRQDISETRGRVLGQSGPPPPKVPRYQNASSALDPQSQRSETSQTGQNAKNKTKFAAENVALEMSVLQFAESRSSELVALSKQVEFVGGTKLSFQRLPRHMRRRAMSHNIRRIPQRLRMKAQAELAKREKKSANKRPSRCHRRRPSNLLSEYQRRQRSNMWLETHIWHAKRFKMTTAWGYRLPVHPSDKSLRACYRATTYHCLLQDVSFECCIEVRGPGQAILDVFSHITSKDTGLTVAAKTTNTGQRWGTVMMYSCDCYPQGAVAPVTYLWQPEASHSNTDDSSGQSNAQQTEIRVLWLWCHPASYEEVWSNLRKACSQSSLAHSGHGQENEAPEQRGGNVSLPPGGTEERIGLVHLCSLKDQLIKFRLTGPASNLVLSETLQMADISSVKENQQGIATDRADGTETRWWQEYYSREERKSQFELQANGWERVTKCQSPDELPPRAVLALTVRDPRVLLPSTRTKVALDKADSASEVMTWAHLPLGVTASPLWESAVRKDVTESKMTEQEMNRLRSQLIVPGSMLQLGAAESRVPVLLLQRPGSHWTTSREGASLRAGVGSGWDFIAPKGWGMAFWVAMVYRGARVGGLREARSLAARSGTLYFPHDYPDCSAGCQQQLESQDQCLDVHVRRPPAKRVNYCRLGVPAPFHCPWPLLVAEWQKRAAKVLNPLGIDTALTGHPAGVDKPSNGMPTQSKAQGKAESCGIDSRGDGSKACEHNQRPYILRNRRLLRSLEETMQGVSAVQDKERKSRSLSNNRLLSFLSRPQHKVMTSDHIRSLVPIAAACVSRGVPSTCAMVCLPSTEDLEHIASDSSFRGPVERLHPKGKTKGDKVSKAKTIKKEPEAKAESKSSAENADKGNPSGAAGKTENTTSKSSKKSLNAKQLQEKLELLKEPTKIVDATDRPVIGFLTNGDFDLGQGCGSGVGYCSLIGLLAAFENVNPIKPLLVLLRNPSSRQYRFARLSVLT